MQIYYLSVLEVTSSTQVSWEGKQGVSRAVFISGDFRGESVSFPFTASTDHPHSLVHGSLLYPPYIASF